MIKFQCLLKLFSFSIYQGLSTFSICISLQYLIAPPLRNIYTRVPIWEPTGIDNYFYLIFCENNFWSFVKFYYLSGQELSTFEMPLTFEMPSTFPPLEDNVSRRRCNCCRSRRSSDNCRAAGTLTGPWRRWTIRRCRSCCLGGDIRRLIRSVQSGKRHLCREALNIAHGII